MHPIRQQYPKRGRGILLALSGVAADRSVSLLYGKGNIFLKIQQSPFLFQARVSLKAASASARMRSTQAAYCLPEGCSPSPVIQAGFCP
jgi:hypothetical protein